MPASPRLSGAGWRSEPAPTDRRSWRGCDRRAQRRHPAPVRCRSRRAVRGERSDRRRSPRFGGGGGRVRRGGAGRGPASRRAVGAGRGLRPHAADGAVRHRLRAPLLARPRGAVGCQPEEIGCLPRSSVETERAVARDALRAAAHRRPGERSASRRPKPGAGRCARSRSSSLVPKHPADPMRWQSGSAIGGSAARLVGP